MNKRLMLEGQWKAETQTGESLHFEACKGGYFSTNEEFGLKVKGTTFQSSKPTPDNPIPIQCVKKGTKIICGNEITVPCDLYDGDIWYPASGKVENKTFCKEVNPRIELKLFNVYKRHNETCEFNFTYFYNFPWEVLARGNAPMYCDKAEVRCYGNVRWFYMKLPWNVLGGLTAENTNNELVSAANNYLQQMYDNGTPFIVVYETENTKIEQYEPQNLYAPKGNVNVYQAENDKKGILTATMLVKSR